VVEQDAELGADGVMEPFARICQGVLVGKGAMLGQGAVAGGLAQVHDPAVDGGCRIGDGCRLGEYATVNRSAAARGETRLGDGVLVLAYAHVAHDCEVGDGAVLANGVQLGGHVEVGTRSFLGGGAHVHQHVRIGEMAFAAGRIRLDRDLAPWSRALGEPPRWAGLNRIAFSRAPGRGDPVRAQAALRILFRDGLRLQEAMDVLANRSDAESLRLARFIQGGMRGLLRPKG